MTAGIINRGHQEEFQPHSTSAESNTTDRTTSYTNSNNNNGGNMDLNVTAGVFMVLMIAIVTAILLCCCKTYVVCKKRRQRQRSWDRNVNIATRGGLHRHLPIEYTYGDAPPSYEDILSGRMSSSSSSSSSSSCANECVGTFSNENVDPKTTEDSIVVNWRCEDQSIIDNTPPPPLYSCVVLENENVSSSDVQPPDYDVTVSSVPTGQHRPTLNNNINLHALSTTVFSALQTVSALVSRKRLKRDTSSTHHSRTNFSTEESSGNAMSRGLEETNSSSSPSCCNH